MVKTKKPGRPAGPLDGSPSHLMHRVLQLTLDIYASEAGPGAPTQRQFAVLAACDGQTGLTQTELVRATGIDRSTLADLVARMTARGLLTRERSIADARANAVRLSDLGRTTLEAARPRVAAADKRVLGLLPKGKRDVFMKLLADLTAAADVAPDQARIEAKALKRAEKEARKAGKAARKAAEAAAAGAAPAAAEPPKVRKVRRAPAA